MRNERIFLKNRIGFGLKEREGSGRERERVRMRISSRERDRERGKRDGQVMKKAKTLKTDVFTENPAQESSAKTWRESRQLPEEKKKARWRGKKAEGRPNRK